MPADQIGSAVGEPTPDVIEPIVGWRAWRWDDAGLSSITKGTRWLPGEALSAECVPDVSIMMSTLHMWGYSPGQDLLKPEPHAAPGSPTEHPGAHACGIYAYSTPEACWRNLAAYGGAANVVLGEVLLSGRVYTHEHGYRAERARVGAICRPTSGTLATIWGDPVDALARFYGVPIIEFPLPADDRDRIDAEQAKAAEDAAAAYMKAVRDQHDRSTSGWFTQLTPVPGLTFDLTTYIPPPRSRLARVLGSRAWSAFWVIYFLVLAVYDFAVRHGYVKAVGVAALGGVGWYGRQLWQRHQECSAGDDEEDD